MKMKDRYLFVFSGQSNMQGETEGLPEENPEITGALEYRYLTDTLVPLMHPAGEDIEPDMLLAPCFGCGSIPPWFCDAFIQEVSDFSPLGDSFRPFDVVAVHAAKGATTISQWLPETERFSVLCNKIDSAVKASEKDAVIIKRYFVWLQGESDALSATSKSDYKERTRTMYSELKKRFCFDGFLIIRVGKFAGNENDIEIIRAQEELCRDYSDDFKMVTRLSGKLTSEPEFLNPRAGGHYNNDGLKALAEASARAAVCLVKGNPLPPDPEYYPEV